VKNYCHRPVIPAALVCWFIGAGWVGATAQQRSGLSCAQEQQDARDSTSGYNDPEMRAFGRAIDRAVALFRFQRPVEARAQLERASRMAAALSGSLLPEDRALITQTLGALRSCVSTGGAGALARLRIRVQDVVGRPVGAGVTVEVEGIRVGRTDARGEVTVRVPSGPVSVEVMAPPGSWGEGTLTVSAGGSATVSVVLDDGKEFGYETDLSLIEAPRGVFDGASQTFVLRFAEDERLVSIRRIEQVELVDGGGDVTADLTDLFRLSTGTIVATSVPELLVRLPKDSTIRMRVQGTDGLGFYHVNRVHFRVR